MKDIIICSEPLPGTSKNNADVEYIPRVAFKDIPSGWSANLTLSIDQGNERSYEGEEGSLVV